MNNCETDISLLSRAQRMDGSVTLRQNLPLSSSLQNLCVFAVQTLGIVHFLEDSFRRR